MNLNETRDYLERELQEWINACKLIGSTRSTSYLLAKARLAQTIRICYFFFKDKDEFPNNFEEAHNIVNNNS